MLTSKRLLNEIDDIVERAYLSFLFMLIGEDFLTPEQKIRVESLGLIMGRRPLIELLYLLVRQRSTPGYRKDRTLNELLDEFASTGILPVINDTHQYSIDHAKAEIHETLESAKREMKKKVKQAILKENNDLKNQIEVSRISSVPQLAQMKEEALKRLLVTVATLIPTIHTAFVKAFTTSLTNFVNNAAVDQATTTVVSTQQPKEVRVYKEVINDDDLCQWCAKFYRNADGSPKVYALKDLQANGSNEGKPKSQWRPVIGSTHPRCRCQLHYLS